jgi:hypothetical protein
MGLSKDQSFYVYLNSAASYIAYPDNTLSTFTNRMNPCIELDNSDGDYYVGLENIFFPKGLYTIKKFDNNFNIKISLQYKDDFDNIVFAESFTYTPNENISGESIEHVIVLLNNDIVRFLKTQQIIKNEQDVIFYISNSMNIVEFSPLDLIERTLDAGGLSKFQISKFHRHVRWEFSEHIGDVLGITDLITFNPIAMRSPQMPKSVDNVYVYTDIINPTRLGEEQINILDILPLSNTYSKSVSNVIYHKVKSLSTISSISIQLLDVYGKRVPFHDGGNIVLILNFIKKRMW